MKLCDRCPGSGGCLLNYLGKACDRWRKTNAPDVFVSNGDRIRAMSDEELIPMIEELCEDGIPSEEYMRFWLQQPAEENGR